MAPYNQMFTHSTTCVFLLGFLKKVFLFVCFGGEMSVCPTPAQVEPASLPEL